MLQRYIWVLLTGLLLAGSAGAEVKPVSAKGSLLGSPVAAAPSRPSARTININTADTFALAEGLEGIGAVKAQAIVDWRRKHGAFSSLAQLEQVKGIGPKTIEKNRSRIVFR